MKQCPTCNRFLAFTLAETLVAIAILAALLALAFPFLGKITERSNAIRCSDNLRNMGIACFAYTADHNGTLPGPTVSSQYAYYTTAHVEATLAPSTKARQLIAFLAPYLGLPTPTEPARRNEALFPSIAECPTEKRQILANQGLINQDNAQYFSTIFTAIKEGAATIEQRPFGYNSASTTTPLLPMKLALVKQPSSTVALRDTVYGRHGGLTHFLLIDGRVLGLKADEYELPSSGRIRIK